MATLSELRTEVRRRADQENSTFITDSELTSYINNSAAELYDLLVGKFEDYYTISEEFTLSGSDNTEPLPDEFYKLRGLDFQNGGNWEIVRPFVFAQRNSTLTRSYRVVGEDIHVVPASSAPGTYRLWWIPRFNRLVDDTDVLEGMLDFEEYVIVDAAIKCLVKEESDPSALMTIKEQLKQRINTMAANRDASGDANRVADVSGGAWNDDEWRWWSNS